MSKNVIPTDGEGNALYSAGQYYAVEDTSFVTGDSPASVNFVTQLGHNANSGYFINDGPGSITLDYTKEGTTYGSTFTIKAGEIFSLRGKGIKILRMTWVSNSAYRIWAN